VIEDEEIRQFLRTFQQLVEYSERVENKAVDGDVPSLINGHLGQPFKDLSVISESIGLHRYVDWDIALDELASRDPESRLIGIGGPDSASVDTFADFSRSSWGPFPVAEVSYLNVPSGVDETRQVVAVGVRLFTYNGDPVAVLQYREDSSDDPACKCEVVAVNRATSVQLLDELRALADARSVLKGKVLSFEGADDDEGAEKFRFVPRVEVPAEDVILPEGAMERIHGHVIGIAENAERLLALGQHLKRGVLLYGPPGTGKTHTVRYLIGQLPEHTVVVLRGVSLRHINEAVRVARSMQPAVVVLEDCDLVAQDRSFSDGANPLLFTVLDAVDGLDADVDVTFLFTTNRVEVLEEALAQRPGRVDLAVEVPLPSEADRLRLLKLYGRNLSLSEEALADVAERTEGVTGSFAKELMRRTVLQALARGEEPGDERLLAACEEQMADAIRLDEEMHADPLDAIVIDDADFEDLADEDELA